MRILIVDDEESERTVLKDILKTEPGIELHEAVNGLDGIQRLLEGKKIQLCLMDITMPELDGVGMLQRIRRDPELRGLHVVVCSANRDRQIVLSLAQMGISGYLLKPFEPAKVLALVQQLTRMIEPKSSDLAGATTHQLLSNVLLLVDDADEVRTIIRDAVQAQKDWSVVEAGNGKEALELLRKGLRPTLCMCDLRMPVMDGLAFMKAVREDSSFGKTPVIIITGDSSSETVRQFAELHVNGYLVKPFDVDKLKGILRNAAEQRY